MIFMTCWQNTIGKWLHFRWVMLCSKIQNNINVFSPVTLIHSKKHGGGCYKFSKVYFNCNSLSSNYYYFCRGISSPLDTSVWEFFIISSGIFAASGSPSPSFLLGELDIELHFSTVFFFFLSLIILKLSVFSFHHTQHAMSCDSLYVKGL